MSIEVLMVVFIGGLFALFAVGLGIATLGGWIGRQIEARQKRPQLEDQAAAKRADAERKLEEARIRRLELELGIALPGHSGANDDGRSTTTPNP